MINIYILVNIKRTNIAEMIIHVIHKPDKAIAVLLKLVNLSLVA